MDHQNIAKVLNAGATDTGSPYFVMDLVTGVPITEYCNRNHLIKARRDRLVLIELTFVEAANRLAHHQARLRPSHTACAPLS